MARKPLPSRPDPVVTAPVMPVPPTPAPTSWTTTQTGVVRRLHAAGILACNTYGQPLVFEYPPEARPRIEAILGPEAMG